MIHRLYLLLDYIQLPPLLVKLNVESVDIGIRGENSLSVCLGEDVQEGKTIGMFNA